MGLTMGKDGYYRASARIDGKKHVVTGKSEAEAFIKLGQLKEKLERGEQKLCKDSLVKQWAEEWLSTYKKDTMTAKSFATYRQKIDKHILPAIGGMKLKDVKDIHLQKILNSQKGLSFSHLSKLRMVMNQMFERAVKSHLIIYSPACDLVLPDYKKGTHRSVSDMERKAIVHLAASHNSGLWVLTILRCGLRPGETIPLQWKDIDFKAKRVRVRTALESGTKDNFKDPKTEAGIRDVPIPDDLLTRLETECGGPFEYIFTQQKDQTKPHTESSLYSYWKSFKRDLDISMGAKVYRNQIVMSVVAEDLTPYCLRHTYCTDLQRAGVQLNVAKYLMGHSDIKVTANIYTHTTDDVIEAALQSINSKTAKNALKETASG